MVVPSQWSYIAYDGSSWIAAGSFPNPGNSAVTTPVKSNQKVLTDWNGNKIFLTPSTKYQEGTISWEITEASSTVAIFNELDDLNKNHRKLAITDHVSNTYTGYFGSVDRILTLSGETQRYIIKCTLVQE